jgi:hypothetical protein
VFPLIEPVSTVLWSSVGKSWRKMTSKPYFLIPSFSHSKMVDVQTSELDTKLAPVSVGLWYFVWWKVFKWWTTLYKLIFCENKKKKCEYGGQLKVKIRILLYGYNSWTTAVCYSERSFTYRQILYGSLYCMMKLLSMAVVQNFEFVRTNAKLFCVELCSVIS